MIRNRRRRDGRRHSCRTSCRGIPCTQSLRRTRRAGRHGASNDWADENAAAATKSAAGGQAAGKQGAEEGTRGAAWPGSPGHPVAATRAASPYQGNQAAEQGARETGVTRYEGRRESGPGKEPGKERAAQAVRRGRAGRGRGRGTRGAEAPSAGGTRHRLPSGVGQHTLPNKRARRDPPNRVDHQAAVRVETLVENPPKSIFATGRRITTAGLAEALGDPSRPTSALEADDYR